MASATDAAVAAAAAASAAATTTATAAAAAAAANAAAANVAGARPAEPQAGDAGPRPDSATPGHDAPPAAAYTPEEGVRRYAQLDGNHQQSQGAQQQHHQLMQQHQQQHQHRQQRQLQPTSSSGPLSTPPQRPSTMPAQLPSQLPTQLPHQSQNPPRDSFYYPYNAHQYYHQPYYPGPPAPFYSPVPPYYAHAAPYMPTHGAPPGAHHHPASSPVAPPSFPPVHQQQQRPHSHPHQAHHYASGRHFPGIYDPLKKVLDNGIHRSYPHHSVQHQRQHHQSYQTHPHAHPHQHSHHTGHRHQSVYGHNSSSAATGNTSASIGHGTPTSTNPSRKNRERSFGAAGPGPMSASWSDHAARGGHASHGPAHHADPRGHQADGSGSGSAQQPAAPQDERATQLDSSAAEAVENGNPVMLSLLITSWANSLNEATAEDAQASAEARAFEDVFTASDALQIVTRYVLFGMSGDQSNSAHSAVPNDVNGATGTSEGATLGELSAMQKSLVSLNRRVLYGDESMHENVVRFALDASPKPSLPAIELFGRYLVALRALAADVRFSDTLRYGDEGHAGSLSSNGKAIEDHVAKLDSGESKGYQEMCPRDEMLMRPWRLAIARLHAECSAIMILRNALENLSDILPLPVDESNAEVLAETETSTPSGSTVARDEEQDSSKPLNSLKNNAESPKSVKLRAHDQLLKNVFDCVKKRLHADITERSDMIREKWWPALAHGAGTAICRAVSERAAQCIATLEESSSNISIQLRSMGLGFSPVTHVDPNRTFELVNVVEMIAKLVQEHLSAMAAAEDASDHLHVLLTSLRSIGVASVKAGVAPPSKALMLFYGNISSAFSGLDDVRAWSFAPLHTKVVGCLRKSSQPRQRSLRFEEPSSDSGEGTPDDGSPSGRRGADDGIGVSPVSSSTTGSAQRHKPRHVRMKSSPDELLNLHIRFDDSDEDEEYGGSLEPEFRRPSPSPGVPASALSAAMASARGRIREHSSAGAESRAREMAEVEAEASVHERAGVANEPCSSDDDDGMIVHDDAHETDILRDSKHEDRMGELRGPHSSVPPPVSARRPPVAGGVPSLEKDTDFAGLVSGAKGKVGALPSDIGSRGTDAAVSPARSKGNRVTFDVDNNSDLAGHDEDGSDETLLDDDEDVKGPEGDSPPSFRSPNPTRSAQSSPGNPHMRSMSVDNIGPF